MPEYAKKNAERNFRFLFILVVNNLGEITSKKRLSKDNRQGIVTVGNENQANHLFF